MEPKTPATNADLNEDLSTDQLDVAGYSNSDEPATKDSLGFEPYVEAMAAFLSNPLTSTPLTVSIEGKWGSGKSSFLKQLQGRLTNTNIAKPQQPSSEALLARYGASRTQFGNLEAYMPVVTSFLNEHPDRFALEKARFESASAHVLSISPLSEGATVDPSVKQLVVHFDKEMERGQYSINYGPGGKDDFPITGTPLFTEGNRDLVLPVTLRERQAYDFVLTPQSFRTKDGYPLVQETVSFRTSAHAEPARNASFRF